MRGAWMLALAMLAAAPGCATLAMLRPLPRACPGPLVPVEEMGADFALRAGYRVRSGAHDEALTLVGEKRADRFVLVGLDPFGTPVFTLVQEGGEVRRERHLRPLFPFAPENALRDVQAVRFPRRTGASPGKGEAQVPQVLEEDGRFTITRAACDWQAQLLPHADPLPSAHP